MLDPVERDEDMGRTYYPLPGGWEVQTKGRGSTFRICDTKTGERCAVIDSSPDTMVHHAIEQIAVEARAEIERLQAALKDIDTTAEFFVQDGVSADAMRGGHYTIRSKAQAALGRQAEGTTE